MAYLNTKQGCHDASSQSIQTTTSDSSHHLGDLAVPGLMATGPLQSHRLLTGSSVDTAIGSVAVLIRAAIAVASFWASTLVRKRRPLRFHLLFDALKISGAHERGL